MAGRAALRSIARRFSSSGKILSEEEKAAENVYIKKMEKEKLEKAARQGPKPAEATGTPASGSGIPPVSDAGAEASSSKVSSDKNRNYAVVAGALTILGAVGWYLKSGSKKTEEVHE